MKKIYIHLLLITLVSGHLFGQTNTFPSSGNVGIGTTTPSSELDVHGTIGSTSRVFVSNPANIGATVSLDWHSDIARLRIGGNGTGNRNGLDIQTIADVSLMRILDNGNVGIGTTLPNYPLHVRNTSASARARFHFGAGALDLVTYAPGTEAYSNSTGVFVTNLDGLIMVGNANDLRFVTFNSAYIERMRIKANGNVGIGTLNPTEKLSVNGTIRAKEVKLEATNWPDYVFEKEYSLMPLEEVKAFIDQNGHLPGLKSASEYQEEGVSMLELNQKLLEKVEELTLHIVRQQETQHQQASIIKIQQERLVALEEMLDPKNK